jgi:tripartite-type tricarboxylate transporter receptor subunit TctC
MSRPEIMKRSFRRCLLCAAFSAAAVPLLTTAQSFPSKSIRVFTAEPGGGLDMLGRLIGQGAAPSLGQPMIILNRGADSGVEAAVTVAKAPPDGHTLLLYGSTMWTQPFLRANLPYDPVRDFAPITVAVVSINVLVVNRALPVRNVKELISLAKARPGELNYASGPAGTTTQLAAELLMQMTGTKMVRVNYRGNAPAIADVISGQVQLMFPTSGVGALHVKSGRLKGLAVTSAEPSPLFPGMPTVAESGVPGFESVTMSGLFAPTDTPAAIIQRLNQEVVRVLNMAEVKTILMNSGVEVVGSAPEHLASMLKSEMAKWGKVIKAAGVRAE